MATEKQKPAVVNPPVVFHGKVTFTPPGGGDLVTAAEMNACISAAVATEFGGSCGSELKQAE